MNRFFVKYCFGTLIGVIFLCIAVAEAEQKEQNAAALSLEQAIGLAVRKNPNIEASRSQVEASRERIAQARSGFLPQIDFNERFSRSDNPTQVFSAKLNQGVFSQQDFEIANLNNPDPINNFTSQFSATWPLFDAGQSWFGWQQAKLGHQAASVKEDFIRQQIIAAAVTAYIGALLSSENLAVVQQSLETAQAHLRLVQSRYKSGMVVKSDLLRAQVHIADIEQQRLEAESRVEIALAVLNQVMGAPIESRYELVDPLERGEPVQGSLEKWTGQAIAQRLDLQQLQFQEDIAQAEIKKSQAAHLPSLSLVGSYDINTEDFSGQENSYSVGAVLSLNLFSGQRLSANSREAAAALKEINARQKGLEQQIRLEIRRSFLQAQTAWKRIQVAQAARGTGRGNPADRTQPLRKRPF